MGDEADLTGVYKDADGDLFTLHRTGDGGYQMVFAGGTRHTGISNDDAKRLTSHSTKQDADLRIFERNWGQA